MHPTHGISLPVDIIEVYDGDTITVQRTWTARVRLLDCWAPEVKGGTPAEKAAGQRSKEFLSNIALNKQGTLLIPTQHADRVDDVLTMGRVLGHVWVEGLDRSLSEIMVSRGYATKDKT